MMRFLRSAIEAEARADRLEEEAKEIEQEWPGSVYAKQQHKEAQRLRADAKDYRRAAAESA